MPYRSLAGSIATEQAVGTPYRNAAKTMPFGGIVRLFIILLGLVLQFNPEASQWGLPLNRLSDGIALILMVISMPVGLRYFPGRLLTFLGVFSLLLAGAILFKNQSGAGDIYPVLIFFAYASSALLLVRLGTLTETLLDEFAFATLVGFGLAAAIQFVTPFVPFDGTGLVPAKIVLEGNARIFATIQNKPGGMWAQGNESGHVYALAAVAAFYLALRRRALMIYILYFTLLIGTFFVTLNRAGLVAPTILLIVVAGSVWRFRDRLSLLIAVLILVPAGIVFASSLDLSVASTIVEERTAGDSNLSSNIEERLVSTSEGVELALENPFGLGMAAKRFVMRDRVGISATHNAVLSASFDIGVATVLLFLVGLVRSFKAIGPGAVFLRTNAFLCLSSGMFEDLFRSPTYMFSFTIVAVVGVVGAVGSQSQRRSSSSS